MNGGRKGEKRRIKGNLEGDRGEGKGGKGKEKKNKDGGPPHVEHVDDSIENVREEHYYQDNTFLDIGNKY